MSILQKRDPQPDAPAAENKALVSHCPGLTEDAGPDSGVKPVMEFSKPGYANSFDTDYGRVMDFKVDFTQKTGKIKPLHGVNNSPVTHGEILQEFVDAGIPFVRTHDTAGAFGGSRFIDVSNIFPDMDADENDPASYDFVFTDSYIRGLTASGSKIFYRLGVTIENFHKLRAYNINPPEDNLKYARVCEKIIRHYNEGWADGMHCDITYWEIWNEPENPNMWTGTMEQFFEFYRVVSNHLKNNFPHLKIGGYAGCGFYGMNRHGNTEFTRSFLYWFDEFLKYIKDEKTASPLDFYSWHLYSYDPMEIIMHAEYVDEKLKAAGLTECENIFNEWNYIDFRNENRWDDMKMMQGACFVGAAMILMQHSPIDKAMYYDALPTRKYCGLYTYPAQEPTRTFAVFKLFNELYKLGNAVLTAPNPEKDVFILAASNDDGSKRKMLVVNKRLSGIVFKLELAGAEKAVSLRRIDNYRMLEAKDITAQNNTVVAAPMSVVMIDFE